MAIQSTLLFFKKKVKRTVLAYRFTAMRLFFKQFRRSHIRVCLISAASIFVGLNSHAAVNWRLHLGGMYALHSMETERKSTDVAFQLGCEVQFPIKEKFFIETGLNLRFGPTTYTYWDGSYMADFIPFRDFDKEGNYIGGSNNMAARVNQDVRTFLDLPARFCYRLRLKGSNELQFAFGPYFEAALSGNNRVEGVHGPQDLMGNNPFSIGLTPSVVFRHRALSLGVVYQNPCIYNGNKNRDTNVLMFTIGVNFKGRKVNMDKLAEGLEVASAVLNTTTAVMSQYVEQSGSGSGYSDDSGSSYSSGSSSGSKSSSKRGSGIADRTSRNSEKATYYKWETMVQNILRGDDTVNKKSEIQRKMRKLREKWAARGDGWPASEWENK